MYFNNFVSRAALLALALSLMTACGGGGGGGDASSAPVVPSLNVLPAAPAFRNQIAVTVDSGPPNAGYNVNRLYTDVTVCEPGSTTRCQTIKHVLVDTGSTGLRLLASAMATELNLGQVRGAGDLPLLNCAQFIDNTFVWGPVVRADVWLGALKAPGIPIQVIADPVFNPVQAACSAGAVAHDTVRKLGANGILGLGLRREDCGPGCINNPENGFYYTCTDASCTAIVGATATTTAQQLKNPVPLFAIDNNGVLIDLPPVSSAGAPRLTGALIFGMGTQSNNQLAGATGFTTNREGYIFTEFGAQVLDRSFVDSGSNGLFFESTMTRCSGASSGFYCPASSTPLTATLRGSNGATLPVSFEVDNALALFGANSVLPTLAGSIAGQGRSFDWGLPFFYGRRVFIGIEGEWSSFGVGPLYAF